MKHCCKESKAIKAPTSQNQFYETKRLSVIVTFDSLIKNVVKIKTKLVIWNTYSRSTIILITFCIIIQNNQKYIQNAVQHHELDYRSYNLM